MKPLCICFAFLNLCCSLYAQTSNESIEIEGVQVRPGINVNEALLLLKGKNVRLTDSEILITVPHSIGNGPALQVIRGTLHIDNETVVSACRPWAYSTSDDSELARVLFAAVSGSMPKEGTSECGVGDQGLSD